MEKPPLKLLLFSDDNESTPNVPVTPETSTPTEPTVEISSVPVTTTDINETADTTETDNNSDLPNKVNNYRYNTVNSNTNLIKSSALSKVSSILFTTINNNETVDTEGNNDSDIEL
ncbi:hypothetical protein PIROE2DRAFT_9355 [Piromyces sp. E2]|nr:hypothetical protein PIROE2DRAFT_9355 [Piromyces sp. E2]|eukprot:OUM63972.1 hypothetical protein PIROE2DRAFT_9355 [Piromyces sp. E2]